MIVVKICKLKNAPNESEELIQIWQKIGSVKIDCGGKNLRMNQFSDCDRAGSKEILFRPLFLDVYMALSAR